VASSRLVAASRRAPAPKNAPLAANEEAGAEGDRRDGGEAEGDGHGLSGVAEQAAARAEPVVARRQDHRVQDAAPEETGRKRVQVGGGLLFDLVHALPCSRRPVATSAEAGRFERNLENLERQLRLPNLSGAVKVSALLDVHVSRARPSGSLATRQLVTLCSDEPRQRPGESGAREEGARAFARPCWSHAGRQVAPGCQCRSVTGSGRLLLLLPAEGLPGRTAHRGKHDSLSPNVLQVCLLCPAAQNRRVPHGKIRHRYRHGSAFERCTR